MEQDEPKSSEKYTQFTQPYPNRIEPDLELNEFPVFTDIELTNPTKSQLNLRGEEAKRLNIIYDNNNTSYEDKNIKEILSSNGKIANRLDDIYDIDLPDCFMRPSVVKLQNDSTLKIKEETLELNKNSSLQNLEVELETDNKKEIENKDNNVNNDENNDNNNENKNENIINHENENKENKNENVNEKQNHMDINDDYEIDIDFDGDEKDQNENLNVNVNGNIVDKNNIEEKKERGGEMLKPNKNGIYNTSNPSHNIKKEDSNNEISSWGNKDIIDMDDYQEKTTKKNHFSNKNGNNSNNKYNKTTLNIIGEKSYQYYLGEIIEKGPNFPSTLGIIKYMDLEEFSENFYNEKLQFEEIAMRDSDFEKIIKLIPIGNKKYIFSQENASKAEINKEENDLIILHGKAAQETFYYIMKLTGQINRSSEYTIYKVKNNKKLIKHFKESIGLIDEGRRDTTEGNIIMSDNINYGIVEDPDMDYYIMPGQLFLTKYRKLMKKEKEVDERKRQIEEKDDYNKNFEERFNKLKEEKDNIINEKKNEIERKIAENEKLRSERSQVFQNEQSCLDEKYSVEKEKKNMELWEEDLKRTIRKIKTNIEITKRTIRDFESINQKIEERCSKYGLNEDFKILLDKDEIKSRTERLVEKRKIVNSLNNNIFCCLCHIKKKNVIFCECSHLMICKNCLDSNSEKKGNKIKASCPACKRLCKKFFFISD